MIDRLTFRNFKCFDLLSLPLATLTLLTGFNAAGKSTTLQTLLLLAQAVRQGGNSRYLQLNGNLTRLGSPGEMVREGGAPEVVLGISERDIQTNWRLVSEDRNSGHTLLIKQIEWNSGEESSVVVYVDQGTELFNLLPKKAPEPVKKLCHGLKDVIYLSAVRAGADDVYPSPEISEPVWADVGMQGEYAAWWFEKLLDEEVDPLRRHSSESSAFLRRQFNAWVGELFPGAEANAFRLGNTGLVQLEFRNHGADEWRRPANIGYGLSYAFPIIVAGLIARSGQILIIDSPEAHLHPMAQSKMGVFLAALSAAGVQIIIETHSDHVLNGVRLAIKQGVLPAINAAIHFFNHRPRSLDDPAHVVSPQIDKNGNLSEWPRGFFDQAEKDLATLADWT